MDFSKYYETPVEDTSTTDNLSRQNNPEDDPREQLTELQVIDLCKRFSGVDVNNNNAAIVSYQCYNYDENKTDDRCDIIYQASRARVDFSYDPMHPEFATLDLVFPSFDDQELRLMWARLQKWKREISETPIFLIHLLERGSVSSKTDAPDTLVECNILNPILFYLTREIPSQPAEEITLENGEIIGGNIIRLLLDMSLVTFEISETDTGEIKAEVLREEEDRRYLDNSKEYAPDPKSIF